MSGRGLNRLGRTGADPLRLVLVARDRLFRESLSLELAAAGCRIADFEALEAALAHLAGGAAADGLIVEADLAEAAGLMTRRDMPPLVLLAAAGTGWASAGRWDAVGVAPCCCQ